MMKRMSQQDPIRDLAHDHDDLNRRVLELRALLDGRRDADESISTRLSALREQLFLHFAREEEGLLPFVADQFPALAEQVHVIVVAHDTICGALARMVHLATTDPTSAVLHAVFERFEASYAAHARAEVAVLRSLEGKLDEAQRRQLADLVRDL
jgi:iron-sulfur cluster repair protein YtfE (RIC family)